MVVGKTLQLRVAHRPPVEHQHLASVRDAVLFEQTLELEQDDYPGKLHISELCAEAPVEVVTPVALAILGCVINRDLACVQVGNGPRGKGTRGH